jgi:PPM family protein phosphatase
MAISVSPSPCAHLAWAACSDVGRRREHNEDAWGAFALGPVLARLAEEPRTWPPHGFLLCVSDGMGGAAAGEEASALCVRHLSDALHARCPAADPVGALREAFDATHLAVVQAAEADRAKAGMGATLTALWLLPGGSAIVGHVGDSRLYLRREGDWKLLSEDHSVSAGLVRRGEMSPHDAARLRYRSMLEQAMGGDGAPIAPQLLALAWQPDDRFALCSDGLHGPLHDAVEAPFNEGFSRPTLASGAADVVAAANHAGGPDNITVILAQLVPAAGRASEAG